MTKNDFLSKKLPVSDFYRQYIKDRGTTLLEASNEPLKLSDMQELKLTVKLPTGKIVWCGEALFYCCIEDLLSRYNRPTKPNDNDKAYMSGVMIKNFSDWSVLDLPTFVEMVFLSRVPSLYNGGEEYQLVTLDIPNIMGKVEAYDRMRPGKIASQRMITPTCREREWNPDHEHMLFDGTPHEFGSVEEAKRYWKNEVDYSNEGEKKRAKSIASKYQGVSKKVS